MPTYRFVDENTGEEFDEFMSISAKDVYLKDNPNIQQLLGMPKIVSGADGIRRTDDNFRDILREIDKKHKGGRKGNSMNKHSSF